MSTTAPIAAGTRVIVTGTVRASLTNYRCDRTPAVVTFFDDGTRPEVPNSEPVPFGQPRFIRGSFDRPAEAGVQIAAVWDNGAMTGWRKGKGRIALVDPNTGAETITVLPDHAIEPIADGTIVYFKAGTVVYPWHDDSKVGRTTRGKGTVGAFRYSDDFTGGTYQLTNSANDIVEVDAANVTTEAPARTNKATGEKIRKQTLDLPKIVAYVGVEDSGEYGNASCPHCGADGRYVWTFVTEGGRQGGAMAGCLKLFPVSPVAEEHRKIIDRQADRAKSGRALASWDVAKLAAIESYAAGESTETEALSVIRHENSRRDAWLSRRR